MSETPEERFGARYAWPVYLVVDGEGGTARGWTDGFRAHEYARNTGGLVVQAMAVDYRPLDHPDHPANPANSGRCL